MVGSLKYIGRENDRKEKKRRLIVEKTISAVAILSAAWSMAYMIPLHFGNKKRWALAGGGVKGGGSVASDASRRGCDEEKGHVPRAVT